MSRGRRWSKRQLLETVRESRSQSLEGPNSNQREVEPDWEVLGAKEDSGLSSKAEKNYQQSFGST